MKIPPYQFSVVTDGLRVIVLPFMMLFGLIGMALIILCQALFTRKRKDLHANH